MRLCCYAVFCLSMEPCCGVRSMLQEWLAAAGGQEGSEGELSAAEAADLAAALQVGCLCRQLLKSTSLEAGSPRLESQPSLATARCEAWLARVLEGRVWLHCMLR
jgi:hypothetical protein